MENKKILHPQRCELCANKKEIRVDSNYPGPKSFAVNDRRLFLGYKCNVTGMWCDERYEYTQIISVVGCASYSEIPPPVKSDLGIICPCWKCR